MRYVCPSCDREFSENLGACPDDASPLLAFSPDRGDPLIGTAIDGRFRIERQLGKGGMGTVYVGVQTSIGREVAVKVMRQELGTDEEAVKRFYREAKVVSRLNHSNIVGLIDFGRTKEGLLFLVMEYIKGRSLSDEIARGPMGIKRTVDIIGQVCDALGEAHAQGIVHRDLKPDNILLTSQANRCDLAKVLDFGIAKIARADGVGEQVSALTAAGSMVGTPMYMSPEQIDGNASLTLRSDLYSLTVIAFEMLAGLPPFRADTPLGVLLKHMGEQPPAVRQVTPGVQIPEDLERFLARNLAKRAEERSNNTHEYKGAMLRAAAGAVEMPLGPLQTSASGGRLEDVLADSDTLVGGTLPGLGFGKEPARSAPAPAAGATRMDPPPADRSEDHTLVGLAPSPAPPRSRRPLVVVIGAVCVALVALGLVLVSSPPAGAPDAPPALGAPAPAEARPRAAPASTPAPPPAAPAATPPAAPPVAPPEPVAVPLRSTPAGADVLVEGEVVGRTPMVVDVPLGKDAIRALLRLQGHAELSVEVHRLASTTGGMSVELTPIRKSPTATQTARPTSRAGPKRPASAPGPKPAAPARPSHDFGLE